MVNKEKILNLLKGKLIISCQLHPEDPQWQEGCIVSMAKAAIWGGAKGLRIEGIENITAVRAITELPIIGLVKVHRPDTDVFMTPDLSLVSSIVAAGADIIAVDGTDRMIDNRRGCDIIPTIKKEYPDTLIFADCRDEKDALLSLSLGADIVAPTFYRFSTNAKSTDLPDWQMFARMCRVAKDKGVVMMEGKIWTPEDCIIAFHYGAHSVVVGTAITRPHITTRRWCDHIEGFTEQRSLFYEK
ncbi:MAG: putative N-acetylmannosamine-6-phosphate 2-epimerase [Erysipelotrichales bacterium]|nr:putative N-acetylmannosamine-6-phosphate 2-epimerase [Erysipelotrichales bacterium]